jgi:DNA-binding PucR family transcriptional regulator
MWGDLAVELLLDRNADRVRSHAEALGYDLDRPHRVALVRADVEAAGLLHAVFATLRALDVEGIAAAVRGDVGIVVAGEPDWDAFARRLTERVGTAHIGVSASADNGGKLAGAKRQAEFALRIGLAIGMANVARYDDLGLYRLLAVDGNPVELLRYVDHWLGPLRDYDGQHASSLLRTLAAYLESGGSLDRTAKELFIHRSTLKYRLARISELLGRDLTDPDFRFHLQLATRAVATFGALGARNDTSGADVS